MKKRVLALFLTLVMAMSVLSAGALAEDKVYDDKVEAIEATGVTANKTASGPDDDGNYTITISVEGSTTTVPGVKNLPADIVLVVDTSTSMNDVATKKVCGGELKESIVGYNCANCDTWYSPRDAWKNGYICTNMVADKTRLDIAKEAASLFASGLMSASDEVRMGVYDFSGSNRTDVALTDDKTVITSAVEGLDTPSDWAADGTDYGLGLSGAAKILKASEEGRQKFVVFISDGEPNNGDYGIKEAKELMEDGVTIMTVGVDMDNSAMRYLGNISSSDDNDNKYCYSASSDGSSGAALDTVLALIQEKIETSINSGTGAVLTDTINTEAFTLVEGSQSAGLTVNENVLTWNIGDIGSEEQTVSFNVKPVEGKYGMLHTNSDVSLSFYSTQQSANVTFNKGAIGDPTVTITRPTAGYTVNYYKDSLDTEPFKTETGAGDVGDEIPYDAATNQPVGYKLGSVTPANPTISSDGDNVVSVLYVEDETATKVLSYTVEYYKDNVKVEGDTQTVTEEIWIGSSQNSLTVDKDEINITNKYDGFAFDYTDPDTIPDTIENDGIIKVYYATDTNGNDIPDYKENKYGVTYKFVSDTDGKELPESGMPALPSDSNTYLTGITVLNKGASTYEAVSVSDGTWTFTSWDADKKEIVDSGITFTGTWTFEPNAPETYPVYVAIYRNGDTDEPYKYEKLDDYAKGDSVDLSELDIATYYSSAYGFEFEGWYNDGGWNQYKAGNPNNTLGDSITVNGWTNIICMVTDYEKVVVKSVTDGDKDNAETIYTNTALHGTNLIDYLDESFTPADKAGYELDKWYNWDWYGHKYADTTTVNGWTNVYVTYTSVEPDAPTAEDLAALKLKVQIDCIDLGVHPNRDYAIEEGTFTTDVKLVNGEWQCALSVEGSAYLTKYNAEFGKHEFSGSSTKTKTLVYGAAGWTLENPSNDRIVFDVRCVEPEAPTYDVLKDMIKVQIDCINKEVSHSNADYDLIENSYDLGTLTANADGTWSCTLTVKSDAYIAKYNETLPGHTLADAYASKNVALVYSVDGKWSRADTSNNIAAVFDVKCAAVPVTPIIPLPTVDEIAELIDSKIIVDCVNVDAAHADKSYGLIDGALVKVAMTDSTTVKVTLSANVYLAQYNDDDASAKHSLASGQSATVTFTLKYVDSKWTLPADAGELPVTFDVVCATWYPPYIPPTEPSEPDYTPSWLNTTDHVSYIIGYEDGTVKPSAGITRAEVATIFFRLLTDGARERFWCETNAYSDVAAGSWYNIAVSTLSNMGILGGYEDGTFRPNASITRAEFAKIAVSFFDWGSVHAVNSFVDVRDSAWYANYVTVAAELGLIEGYGGSVFRPEATITRAEACTIINRTLGRAPDADHLLPASQMNTWPDNDDPGVWYYAQIQEATNSHDYRWLGDIEQWTAKLAEPDWDKLQY